MNHKVVVNGVEFNLEWKPGPLIRGTNISELTCGEIFLGEISMHKGVANGEFWWSASNGRDYGYSITIEEAQEKLINAAKEQLSKLDFNVEGKNET